MFYLASSSILSTSSCCILIFLGDNFLGLHRIGLVDPVSMSCTTASVRPVIGVPGAGNVCMCLAKRLAARALVAREFTRCVEHVNQVWWECAFTCAAFGLASTYVLFGLYFLHARYACTGRNYNWVALTVF